MKPREKMFRALNAKVQNSADASPETKLLWKNYEMALNIMQKLADLVHNSDPSLSGQQALSEKLQHFAEEIQP